MVYLSFVVPQGCDASRVQFTTTSTDTTPADDPQIKWEPVASFTQKERMLRCRVALDSRRVIGAKPSIWARFYDRTSSRWINLAQDHNTVPCAEAADYASVADRLSDPDQYIRASAVREVVGTNVSVADLKQPAADLDMAGHHIRGIASNEEASDAAASQKYVQDRVAATLRRVESHMQQQCPRRDEVFRRGGDLELGPGEHLFGLRSVPERPDEAASRAFVEAAILNSHVVKAPKDMGGHPVVNAGDTDAPAGLVTNARLAAAQSDLRSQYGALDAQVQKMQCTAEALAEKIESHAQPQDRDQQGHAITGLPTPDAANPGHRTHATNRVYVDSAVAAVSMDQLQLPTRDIDMNLMQIHNVAEASTASGVVTLSQMNRAVRDTRLDELKQPVRAVDIGGHRVANVADSTVPTDACSVQRAKQIVDAATEAQAADAEEARRHAAERHAETVQTMAQTRAALKADYTTLVGQTASAVKATVAALEKRVAAAQESIATERTERGEAITQQELAVAASVKACRVYCIDASRDFTKEAVACAEARVSAAHDGLQKRLRSEMPSVHDGSIPAAASIHDERVPTVAGVRQFLGAALDAVRARQQEDAAVIAQVRTDMPAVSSLGWDMRGCRVNRLGDGKQPTDAATVGQMRRLLEAAAATTEKACATIRGKLEDTSAAHAALDADARQRLRGIESSMSSLAEAIQALPVSTTADWNAHHKAIRGVTADAADAASAATVGFVEERCHAVAQSVATMQQTLAKLGADAAARDRELVALRQRSDEMIDGIRTIDRLRECVAALPPGSERHVLVHGGLFRDGKGREIRIGRGAGRSPLHPAREGDAAGWYSDPQGEWTGSSPCTWRPARPAADGSVGRPYPIEGMPPPALVEAPAAMWVTDTKTGLVANIVAARGCGRSPWDCTATSAPFRRLDHATSPCAAREVALCGTQIVHVPPEADVVVDRTVTLASIDDRDDQIQRAVVRDRAGATHSVTLFLDHRASDGGALLAGATPFTPCASKEQARDLLRASARPENRDLWVLHHGTIDCGAGPCGPVLCDIVRDGRTPQSAMCEAADAAAGATALAVYADGATTPLRYVRCRAPGQRSLSTRQLAHVACSTVVGASPWSPAREDLQDLYEATRDLHADLDTVPRAVWVRCGELAPPDAVIVGGSVVRLLPAVFIVRAGDVPERAWDAQSDMDRYRDYIRRQRRPDATRQFFVRCFPAATAKERAAVPLRGLLTVHAAPDKVQWSPFDEADADRADAWVPGGTSTLALPPGCQLLARVDVRVSAGSGATVTESRGPAVVAGTARVSSEAVSVSVAPESECIVTSCVTSAEGDVLDWDIEGYAARGEALGKPLPVWRTLAAVRGVAESLTQLSLVVCAVPASKPYPPPPVRITAPRRPVRLAPPGSHAAAASRWAVEAKALARGYTGLRSALVSNLSDSQLRNVVLDRVFDGEGTTKVAGMGRQELVNLYISHRLCTPTADLVQE